MTRVDLLRPDGTTAHHNFFERAMAPAAWAWIAETVAAEHDCEPGDVHCDDHDRITVNGAPVLEWRIVPNVC